MLRRKRTGLPPTTSMSTSRNYSGSTDTSTSISSSASQTWDAPPPSVGAEPGRALTESPVEVQVALLTAVAKPTAQTVAPYPELDRYREEQQFGPVTDTRLTDLDVPFRIATHDLPPPTPLFSGTSSQASGFSASPSTRFSESPGMSTGPYSRDTTPTSMSSQSPGLVAPMRIPTAAPRGKQSSPAHTRPPVTRRRAASTPNEVETIAADPQGLAAVRESLTSSSSNSTVRNGDALERKDSHNKKRKKKRLSPLPPSPPPRKSSQQSPHGLTSRGARVRNNSRDGASSPSRLSRDVLQPMMTSPAPARATPLGRAQPVASSKVTPPIRPTREGIPDIHSLGGQPVPVIQSNLQSAVRSERRPSSILPPASLARPTLQERSQSQPRVILTEHATLRKLPPSTGDGNTTVSNVESGTRLRTPSPSVSTHKSRFPLFGRRTKTVSTEDKVEKPPRRGPAAGTGHEGYGRFGAPRRRSGSASSLVPGTAGGGSASRDSSGLSQTTDPFLMQRLAPVVISGGEVIKNRNTSTEISRSESDQSLPYGVSGPGFRNSSQVSVSSRESPRMTLWPSAFPPVSTTSSQAPSLRSRRPSESSDSEPPLVMKSTLAYRRSMQKLQSGDQHAPRLPKPIVTRPQVLSPSVTSLDASVLSDDSVFPSMHDFSRGRAEAAASSSSIAIAAPPKKLTKRARSPRRWNFFGRSHSQPADPIREPVAPANTVAATVKVVQSKPVAFYTMMDSSEQEDVEAPDLEAIMREARDVATPNSRELSVAERRPSAAESRGPQATAWDNVTTSSAAPAQQKRQSARSSSRGGETFDPPSPHATGTRDRRPSVTRQTSRPLQEEAESQPSSQPSQQPQTTTRDESVSTNRNVAPGRTDSQAKGPTPPPASSPEVKDEPHATEQVMSQSQSGQTRNLGSDPFQGTKDFLSFSPRKDSQSTATTVTTSSYSSGLYSYADATAIIPEATAPFAEDEVWDEYDDLLGDDISRVPPSAGSSMGKPFHLEIYNTRLASESLERSLEPSTVQASQAMASGGDLKPAVDTQLSVSDIVSELRENRGDSMLSEQSASVHRTSASSRTQVKGTRSSQASSSSHSSSQASGDHSPLSQVNLRMGSITVSKWLTFGHVLFSPAREDLLPEVGSLKRHSIIVIDGLGNDDWGYYAAETYPAASFYNLSPTAPLPADHRSEATFPLSPPNHHQVQYLSHLNKFPFGQESFTSVVYRFPAAAPESHYKNVISEARRVLKPGSYIELAVLDVDLNNVGSLGRRAVRHLKEQIHANAPDAYLGSAADLITRLLGRKGFVDIKTCRVGVPVGNVVTRHSGSEATFVGSNTSDDRQSKEKKKDERSLTEMMNDDSSVADESITKMVAKVGRWWYSRCYESAAVGLAKSMWSDKALLAECEERGTSLKLMVCHARVPESKSRVASI
ncbi:hypothetical protein DL546_003113 [Coniochaeta pulveracea]|uniref:Methyltransferase type 11 domain-containing protein n=1 Tax=Coniochaeta pulveracea TaxID=177199 RepID=A0A420YDG5_9PEZI|nr:hypothetical protein DL546_003113 [Coniochaeta pulveracea]